MRYIALALVLLSLASIGQGYVLLWRQKLGLAIVLLALGVVLLFCSFVAYTTLK